MTISLRFCDAKAGAGMGVQTTPLSEVQCVDRGHQID